MKLLALLASLIGFSGSAHATNFTLIVSTAGPRSLSTVRSTPNGISSTGTWSASFLSGTNVILYETTPSTVVFAGWTGPDGCANNASSCTVSMSAARTVGLKFNPTLTLSLFGNGFGTVIDASGTVNCSQNNGCANYASVTQSYSSGTLLTLSTGTTGNTFFKWSGKCSGTTIPCQFQLNQSEVVVATFTAAGPFTLLVSTGGNGQGLVTSSPSGIYCGNTFTTCSASFTKDAAVTFTATANSGHTFKGWSNAGCSGTSTCVVTSSSTYQSISGPQSPTAFFY